MNLLLAFGRTHQLTRSRVARSSRAAAACLAVFCLLATRSIAQQAVTFNNAAPVSIADRNGADPGVASPYPSTITVAGLTGVLTDVNVTVNGLTGSASDLALLLVSPNGARMILQANVGSTSEHSNVSYTLDDNAGSALPTTSRIRGDRAYRPTVVSVTGLEPRFPASGPNPPPADCLPKEECASATPYGSATMNSAFGGTNPNGTWRLYAVDMAAGRTVSLAGGWSLTFTTDFIEPTPTPNPNATPRPTPTPGPPGGGQLDPTFDGDGKLVPGPFSGFDAITDIAALTDGKLIVLGLINGSNVLARYLSNGQLDASFGSSGQVALVAAELVVLALQQDGKIVIGGTIGGFGPQDFVLLRRNADGSPDTSFDNDGMVRTDIADTNANTQDNNSLSDLVIQPDGKILAVGSDLARYNSNGSLDATFGTGGTIRGVGGRAVALQGDGKFILNSDFFNSQTDTGTMGVRRYHANGSPDTTFGDNGRASVAFANERDVKSRDVLVQPDGRIVVAGSVTRIRLGFGHEPLDGDYICALARFNADGSIDNTFDADGTQSTDAGGLNEIQRLANGPGGSIIAAGTNHKYSGREDFILMRYTAAGALESGFNAGNVVKTDFFARRDELRGLTLQGDGKIVVAGLVTTPSTGRDFGLVRYLANGTLDSSFGTAGRATHAFPGSFSLTTVVVQPDGKILAGGGAGDCYLVVRYTPGGALDGTFGTGGVVTTAFDDHLGIINGSSDVRLNAAFVHELAVTPDGKIVAGGDNNPGQFDWHLTFARYNTDGSADLTFSGDGQFAQLTNGSLISDSQEGFHDMALNCDGALLHTYSVRFGGGYTSFVAGAGSGSLDEALIRSLAVFPDNGFVVGAQDYNYGTGPLRPGFTIARFTRGGNRDGRFGTNGEVHYDFGGGETAPRSLRVQPDHKTVAYLAASSGLAVLARVNPDGSLDNSFGAGGRVQTDLTSNSPGQVEFGQLEVLADGRLLAAGTIDNNYVIERFFSDGTLDTTFGTSGRAIADFGGSDTVNSIAVQPDGRIVAIGRSGIARFTGASSTADVCAAPTPGPAFCSYAASLSTASIAPGTQLVPESRQFPNLRIALPFAFGFYGQSQNEVTVSWAGTLSFNSEGNSASALNSCLPAPGFDNTIFAYWDDLRLGGAESGIYTAVSGTAPNRVFHIEWRMVTDSGDHPVNFEVRLYEGQQNFDIIYNNSATANGVGATVGVQQGTGTNGAAYSELLCDAGILRPGTKVSYAFGGCAPTPLPQPGCQVGGRDRSFDVDGRVRTDFAAKADEAYAIAHQTDGKIVAAGYATVGSGSDFAVARYNQDGSPDSSFGTNGKVTTDFGTFFDRAYAVAIQADGKIVAAGTTLSNSNDFAIARYHANGTLDTSFGTGGLVRTHFGAGADEAFGVVIQNDGKIVAAGYARVGTGNDFALARYLANGTLDASFDTDGLVTTHFGAGADQAAAVVLQPDGKIVLGGRATVGSSPDFALARYNPNGTLDATFSGDGRATTSLSGWTDIASAIALQPDGKIVAAGSASGDFSIDFALARFNSDGTLDTSFDADGKVTRALTDNDDDALSVAIQADGRIVAAGRARFEGNRFALVRYEANGAPDNSFGVGGVSTTSFGSGNEEARAVAIAADGRIAAAGRGLEPAAGATLDFALVRYESTCPDAPPPPTPTPTPTATPIPTATPVPTITPLPTATPTATATATPTPEPTATPSPSPTPEPQPMQLLNIATRLRVQTGENVLIGGIIVTGTEPKKVIIRAIGPSLSAAFDGALADPVLELYQGDTLLASNDNWRDSQQAEIEATTIPPADDLESAIVYTLDPGFYTGVMSGRAGTTGIGVIEVYDLDQAANSKLANIASRGFVEAGENVMIGGLIVGGNGTLPARVLLRAIGPSLGEAGVAGALPDPFMELRDNNGELLSENDNWQDTQSGEIAATTIPPSHPFESAIVTTLPPGNYTAVVRGKNDTTGVGLVEVYTVR